MCGTFSFMHQNSYSLYMIQENVYTVKVYNLIGRINLLLQVTDGVVSISV